MASTLEPESQQVDEFDDYISAQIRKTRGHVKGVELAGAVLRLLVAALVYMFLVALVDHWLLAEGLGLWGRLAALAGFLLGIGCYSALVIAPLIGRRVNPVYAAHTIEQQQPTLKNSLVNFLLLRGHRREVAPAVYEAIELRAASDLSRVPVDTIVDRSRLVRWSYGLLVVVAIFALYVLLSPKDPLRSLARMLAPWADLRPATRVTIDEVEPGDTKAFHGDSIHIQALVRGLREDEPVTLFYSTEDGQTTDRPIVMNVPAGGYRHEADLPESAGGLQQTVEYYLAAGDFETPRYRVEILTAPSIIVEAVEYKYPSYASLADKRVEKIGDIAALVGTDITIHGRANREIKSAYLDYNCDGKRDLTMTVNGQETRVDFPLKLSAEGKPEYESYQLLFVGADGRENPQPIRHRIDVAPDRPPVVEIVLPTETQLDVPQNGAVTIAVRAEDPDFALRAVTLHAKRGNDVVLLEQLLDAPHQGELRVGHVLDLTKLTPEKAGRPKIAAGDTIEYWVEAVDIKAPVGGRSETVRYQLRVTSPTDEEQREEQLAEAEKKEQEFEQPEGAKPELGDEGEKYEVAMRDPAPGEEEPRDESAAGEQGGDEQGGKEGAEGERIDPEDKPADAMREILEHQKEKESDKSQGEDAGQKPSEQDKSDSGEQGDQQPGEQEGDQQEGDKAGEQGDKQDGKQSSEQQGSQGEKSADGQQGGKSQQQGEGEQGGDSPSGESASEGEAGDDAQPGDASGQGKADNAAQQDGKQPGGASGQKPGGKEGESGDANQPSGQPGTGQAEERVKGDQEGTGQGRKEKPEGGAEAGKQGEKPEGGQQGEKQDGEKPPGASEAPGESPQPKAGESPESESQEDAPQGNKPGEQSSDQQGKGGQSSQSGNTESPGKPSEGDKNNDAKGGDPEDPKGDSGAGQSQGNEAGSPSPQEKNTPRDKQQQSPDSQGNESSEPSSPSNSPKESDSQGGEQGDRSGGGSEGGGQKANQKGTGGAGQNTAADEGGGAAEGSGGGPNSNSPGSKQPGGQGGAQGGKSQGGAGESQGAGSSTDGSGSAQGGASPGQGGDGKGGSGAGGGGGNQPGNRPGGGGNGDPNAERPDLPQTENDPAGEEADLDAARKATDLALENLEHEMRDGDIDQELLDRLGWTKEDMARFLERWREMKRKAAGEGPEAEAARKQLEEALRQSLGLQSGGTSLAGDRVETDDAKARESFRSRPPAEYDDLFRAYTEGLSRGRAAD